MGKTGSSAIQSALAAAGDQLLKQRAQYLGMWFDTIDPRYRGVRNQAQFFALPEDEMLNAADRFIEELRERSKTKGVEKFLLSNEALSGHSFAMKPMILKLQDSGIEVQALGYARDPAAWLASAYVQWGVYDKTDRGPIQPFAIKARTLVSWYNGLLNWRQVMGPNLTVRSYDAATDIVSDFAEYAGLVLDVPKQRIYSRLEDAEIVLRAIFNSKFDDPILPKVFDELIFRSLAAVPSLEKILERYLDYSETDAIISERAKLFDEFAAAFGFDVRDAGKRPPPFPDAESVRRRLLDALIEISLEQARRIERLEHRLSQFEKGSNPNE
jgi:hypothetical protein